MTLTLCEDGALRPRRAEYHDRLTAIRLWRCQPDVDLLHHDTLDALVEPARRRFP